MKIVIDIPEEFEGHFNEDRFDDSLHRLSADAHLLAGNYEQETAIMLINVLKGAKILPKEHGRLIDADELREHMYTCETNGRPLYVMNLNERLAIIDEVPTIIKADKERV